MTPILKWAGGKRWLIRSCPWVFPSSFERYIEPFLGGAAIFLWLRPTHSILSDLNADLISMYQSIRDRHLDVEHALGELAQLHSTEYYYNVRSTREADDARSAARFIYLNRTCWNGLYRVNLKGEFNVPRGTKDRVILKEDNFSQLAQYLQGSTLASCDFADTLRQAKSGDFVFLDPPYTVAHNANGFLKYNEHIFTWRDQIRLRNEALIASKRGAKVLILNAAHASVRELYEGLGVLHTVDRHSVISGSANARKSVQEFVIQLGYETFRNDFEASNSAVVGVTAAVPS